MDAAEVIAVLRTFSGPNLGAEVMLPQGSYTIGSDFSCDIVLSDSTMAPRHASLIIEPTEPGHNPRVRVAPLDGEVLLDDKPLPADGLEINPATPWFLGLTCLSWNRPHAAKEEIIPHLPGQAQLAPAPGNALSGNPAMVGGGSGQLVAEQGDNKVGENSTTSLPGNKYWRVWAAALACLLVVLAMSLTLSGGNDSAEEQTILLRQAVREAGLEHIVVSSEGDKISVSGTVQDEEERAKLWTMAQNLNYPVYIRVGVREDMAQAVSMKLNSRGIFPNVTFLSGGEVMRVAAYIKDAQAETAAFNSLSKDMPDLPSIERHIVHADILKAAIERELAGVKLQNISLTLNVGRIELTDTSSVGNHDLLQVIMERVQENLGVPLAYTIITQDTPANNEAMAQITEILVPGGISADMPAEITASGTPFGSLSVTGVTLGPMRFISLSDGQRIFEGGMLPGGHTLEQIALDHLILNKNGQVTTYPLRGQNE